jgi:NAD(P)H dehydrogenase (quinone)
VLTAGTGRGRTHVLTGPVALSTAELAERLSAALGRTVGVATPTPDELRAGLLAQGLPATFADDVLRLGAEVAAGAIASTTTAVADLTARPPRTVEEFLADNLDALRAAVPGG